MKSWLKFTIILTLIFLNSLVQADIPKIINYQGYLSDSSGDPVADGDYLVKFTLWDDPSSMNALNDKWNSGFQMVTTINGSFNYNIGSIVTLPDDLFENNSLIYLGIKIGVDPELSPRFRFSSTAFTFQALKADSAGFAANAALIDGQAATDFAPNLHTHPPIDIIPQGAGSNLDADLLDGIDAADLAMAVHSHQPTEIFPQGDASGLDADLLDGNESSAFATSLHDHNSLYSTLGHPHDAGDLATGIISTDRYSALSDLNDELAIGSESGQIATGDHGHGSDFAAVIHSHNALDISSGILNVDRYSAYSDLITESRLGSGGTQIAIGNHGHASAYVDLLTDQTIMGLKQYIGTLSIGDSSFRADANGVRLGDNALPNNSSILDINRTFNSGQSRYGTLTSVRNNSVGEMFGHSSIVGTTTDGGGAAYGYFSSVINSLTSSNPRYGFFSITGSPNNTSGTSYGIKVSSWGGIGAAVYGIHASKLGTGSGYAGYFSGDVHISGTLSKAASSMMIDHPLDPENQYLQHSMIQSPDMMNFYNGNVKLDANGEALIILPDYFTILNRDFRYQLTCIGGYAPVYIKTEIKNNQFTIAGGETGMGISWQVTGIRHDKWADQHRLKVEVAKEGNDIGKLMHYNEYGVPIEQAVESEQIDQIPQQ